MECCCYARLDDFVEHRNSRAGRARWSDWKQTHKEILDTMILNLKKDLTSTLTKSACMSLESFLIAFSFSTLMPTSFKNVLCNLSCRQLCPNASFIASAFSFEIFIFPFTEAFLKIPCLLRGEIVFSSVANCVSRESLDVPAMFCLYCWASFDLFLLVGVLAISECLRGMTIFCKTKSYPFVLHLTNLPLGSCFNFLFTKDVKSFSSSTVNISSIGLLKLCWNVWNFLVCGDVAKLRVSGVLVFDGVDETVGEKLVSKEQLVCILEEMPVDEGSVSISDSVMFVLSVEVDGLYLFPSLKRHV